MTSSVAEIAEDKPASAKTKRKAIPIRVQNIVWGRAAGRCQYAGCNKLLVGDQISGAANANTAYIGHIVADSAEGPRGDPARSPKLAHDPDNLMLVCDVHHRVFDREMVDEHPEEVLIAMKRRHEARIRTVTGIDEELGSHVIRYAAKIGSNESPVEKGAVKWSMIPERYPLDDGWIDLDLVTLELRDDDPAYWPTHVKNLQTVFNEKVRGRMERQEIKRLAVFGLAPIPLLFELGRLISDIATADVRQLLRDPKGWKWDSSSPTIGYDLRRPERTGGPVALKLEISAPVVDERVAKVVGPDPSIWSIAAAGAHNDIVRRPEDIASFAKLFRKTLDDIKLAHGEHVTVNVFPAIPVSIAIEAGRSWQPKAHPSSRSTTRTGSWAASPSFIASNTFTDVTETDMNVHMRPSVTPEAEETLEDLADSLAIPESRYEEAERSYKSLGDWLNRPASTIRQFDPQVHVQGSFGLDTVIPPISDEEHYDVDAVCEFRKLNKTQTTQQAVKTMLGDEMKLYARARNMDKPVEEHRRCWRLEYAEDAQFHMDVTPGLLNAAEQRALLLSRGLDARFADTAIAITDIDHHAYRIISADWPRSNPRGYLKWFLSRMEVIFEERKRELIRKGVRAGTEPIPFYAVRTPLQSAIMILKRHRDIMFAARSDERPISIIVTTLGAHAYNGEVKISDALFSILNRTSP